MTDDEQYKRDNLFQSNEPKTLNQQGDIVRLYSVFLTTFLFTGRNCDRCQSRFSRKRFIFNFTFWAKCISENFTTIAENLIFTGGSK